jgi:hypothetical protein
MDRFAYLTRLRTTVTAEISGVQDAKHFLAWDDTRPNHLTKTNLARLFEEARKGAEHFGVFVVHRHSSCGSKRHAEDYLMEDVAANALVYGDPRFHWRYPLDQRRMTRRCPCGGDRGREHGVITDVLFAKDADQVFCEVVEDILSDLLAAVANAGDRKPRSGIRERLLRALLVINDHIRPDKLDAYIAARGLAAGDAL